MIAPGARLGPYEILAPLGAGGMGEVYKAKDTRLDRTVAIKVLAGHLSQEPEVRQRFEREARAISSLSHPHICALYDVGSASGADYLVMELLEGETLASRLTRGALPLAQALRIGGEIAEALAAAHRQGVVHRDLKPGNVMLTKSGVKLLDFGLAKARAREGTDAPAPDGQAPTELQPITMAGAFLGTLQYMAPEQLEGREADARSDIFALGCVLYEMVSGRRAFAGSSQASVIAAILHEQPAPLASLQPLTPPALEHAVARCLGKDPDERWQSAADVASELRWVAEASARPAAGAPAAPQPGPRQIAWKLATLLLAIAAVLLALLHWRPPAGEPRLMRFAIPAPERSSFSGPMALSPDGRKLAFIATSAGVDSLWVRSLDALAPQPLPGTEGAGYPFWSPDGRWVAFFAQGKLKKIEASGGSPQILCDASDNRGGTWGRDGVILFSPGAGVGLLRVSSGGGAVTQVTTLGPSGSEISHRWPSFLPDGRRFLYMVYSGQPERQGVFVGSLDSKQSKRLPIPASHVSYAPPGYLLYVDEGTLMGQQVDPASLDLQGQATPLAEQVWTDSYVVGLGAFSVSENGVLAYRRGGMQVTQLTWFDRTGARLGTVGPPGRHNEPYLSGDEKHVVFEDSNLNTIADLWTMDLAGDNLSRFTFDPADDTTAVWSPDGERIVWSSSRSGAYELYEKAASGAGNDELLLQASGSPAPDDWSRDGRFVLYEAAGPRSKAGLWVLPMAGDRNPTPYLVTDVHQVHGRFSPDGRWVAYVSDESGRAEVYVQTFPATGGKWQISNGGGDQPTWRGDGRELFFISAAGNLMATEVSGSASQLRAGVPAPLFPLHGSGIGISSVRNHYVATSDGRRFLVNAAVDDAGSFPITVVLNWTSTVGR